MPTPSRHSTPPGDRQVTARIPIWEPGSYVSVTGSRFDFTDEDMADLVAGYSPARFAAPWVKGHPALDDPAQGWVDSLEWDGRLLWARSSRISPEFAAEVRGGRYAKISPKFFMPDEAGNPTPGKWHLRHVGWLGAVAPANPHLPRPEFSAADTGGLFPDACQPTGLAQFSAPITGVDTMTDEAEIARRERELADREAAFAAAQTESHAAVADLAARESALEAREAEARRAECAAFAASLATPDNARIAPAQVGQVAAILFALPDDVQASFASPDGGEVTQPLATSFRDFLRSLPKQVEYGETASGEIDPPAASFAAPAGIQVDPDRLALHGRAQAYQQAHPNLSYADAAVAVSHGAQ